MTRKLPSSKSAVVLLCLAILLPSLPGQGGQISTPRLKPLSEEDITTLLSGEVPPARIIELVESKGINFVLTAEAEQRLRTLGATDEVIETLRQLGVAPPEAWEHFQEGQKLFVEGDADGALREFDAAAKLAPLWAQVQLNRGMALDSAGSYAEAALAWQRYLELAPEAPDSAQVQERIQAKIRNLYSRSREAFNARRFGEPEDDCVFFWASEVRRVEPDHAGVREMETRALAAYENEARAAAAAQQLDRARQIYQRLMMLFPDNANFPAEIARLERLGQIAALMARAEQAFRDGNLATPAGSSAIEVSREVLKMDPTHVAALDLITRSTAASENQARQAATAGNTQRAMEIYTRLAELFPANPTYRQEIENLQSFSFPAVHYHGMAKRGGGLLAPAKFLHQGCWGTFRLTPRGMSFTATGSNDSQPHTYAVAREQVSVTAAELKYPGKLDDDFQGSGLHLTHKLNIPGLGDFDLTRQGHDGFRSYVTRVWGWQWTPTGTGKKKK